MSPASSTFRITAVQSSIRVPICVTEADRPRPSARRKTSEHITHLSWDLDQPDNVITDIRTGFKYQCNNFILDFADTKDIGSKGATWLIEASVLVKKRGGSFYLANLNPKLRSRLQTLGFEHYFNLDINHTAAYRRASGRHHSDRLTRPIGTDRVGR